MPTVSIIVPVYNVERYLPMCLDSIRAQRFQDIEIVCVNDGSRDRSRLILELYRKVDPRVKIVDKENGGLSSARNAGMRAATGDIICFVDSDDLIVPTFAGRIVEAFAEAEADVVTFGGEAIPVSTSDAWLEQTLSPRDKVYAKFTPDIFFDEACEPFVWRTALRRSFLEKSGIRFDEDLRFGEDKLFHYALYPRSSKTVFIHDKLYLYRVSRAGSLMASRRDDRLMKLYDHVRIVEKISQDWYEAGFIKRYGSELLELMSEFVLIDIMRAPVGDRTILANYLDAVWRTYFTPQQLEKLVAHRLYGSMARAILSDRRRAFGIKRKLVFYMNTLKGSPRFFMRRVGSRALSVPPLSLMKKLASHVFPLSAYRTKQLLGKGETHLEDEQTLVESLALLELELRARTRMEEDAKSAPGA
ncbi:glycosyltransferase [Collinsella sp. AGMB00827]|uniref:Glycosyltransferase n=1 Tax=Collinsella ureilytica TaxID=2869515 RepID=A0ABS7MKR7_9ACTN|nr:glycosyltransferase [Collinsella urealyticum]